MSPPQSLVPAKMSPSMANVMKCQGPGDGELALGFPGGSVELENPSRLPPEMPSGRSCRRVLKQKP